MKDEYEEEDRVHVLLIFINHVLQIWRRGSCSCIIDLYEPCITNPQIKR